MSKENDKNIKDSTIAESANLYRFIDVHDSEVKNNSVVGDFSRIKNSSLGKFVRVDRFNLIFHSTIGDYSYTGPHDMIMHAKIGKFCSIAWGITIGGGEHNYNRISSHDFIYNNFYGIKDPQIKDEYNRFGKECTIGNDVWIGANSTILRDVKIGDGAIIGANTIVTKDIPPYAIVVGNPGKVIKYRFDEKTINQLIEIKWWDLPIEKIKAKFSAFKNENISEAITNLLN
jgi:hypothetical protein